MEAALAAEVVDNVPFVGALLDRFPELAIVVERELERSGAPEIHVVRASPDLARSLPAYLCERLLAVPVFRDPDSGRVDVAAVDVLNPQVASEFGYQLKAPIRVLRASLSAVRSAISGLAAGRAAGALSSGRSQRPAARSSVPLQPRAVPSEPPIPLVRPGLRPSRPSGLMRIADREDPVLVLTRSKAPSPPLPPFLMTLEEALGRLDACLSPDEVADVLARAFDPTEALVLAVRSGSFEARSASAALRDRFPDVTVSAGKNSVFDIAARSGYYLGPLPGTLVHAELRELLREARSEIYTLPVLVAGRPVLMVLVASWGPPLAVTRRADQLADAAGLALARIVRARKQRY